MAFFLCLFRWKGGLSQIDENDLKEFLDEDQQQTLETAPSVVLEDEHTDDTESSMVVVLLLFVLCIVFRFFCLCRLFETVSVSGIRW